MRGIFFRMRAQHSHGLLCYQIQAVD